jgi:hypothetical protein
VTSQNQAIGHVTIDVPAGFTAVGGFVVTTSNAGDATWTASFASGTITLVAPAGNKRLDSGESVTVTFNATAPCQNGGYTFTTHAYQDADPSLNGTEYTLFGSQPVVTVSGGVCVPECTLGLGYWKAHGPIPQGNNTNVWPVTSLTLGSVSYTDLELLSILNTPPAGNGLIQLAHQLIAAKLNVATGVTAPAAIASADALIGALVVPPVGAGSLAPATTSALNTALEAFNSCDTN